MNEQAVGSFIRALAHRERCEVGARVRTCGAATGIAYAQALSWPWPRPFDYGREFFCIQADVPALQGPRKRLACAGEHVLNLFARDLPRAVVPWLEAGYLQAWVSPLLGRALNAPWRQARIPPAPAATVHAVHSDEDMARYASLSGISNPGTARDSRIHNFFACADGQVVAKGQVVLLPGCAAYISDLFTRPSHRRQGLCHQLMHALEARAKEGGATHACLAPGREVQAWGLYAGYGYAQVAARSVLVRRDGPGPRAA